MTKDTGRPRYFLGIKIANSKYRVVLSQQEYALDLLYKTGLLGCKPIRTPMNVRH